MSCGHFHFIRSRGLLLAAFISIASSSMPQSQFGTPPETAPPTFKSTVQVVLVDVVVTNSKEEPVTGLKEGQFQVFEDGNPQKIASFEERAGIPDVPTLSQLAKLPPNVFSNMPLVKTGDAANVLLLDSLNTEMADQSYVHAQMVKYLGEIRPGARMAIFTLSDRLRFVQGFTQDPTLLMAALNGKKSAGNPQLSSRLQTPAEQNLNQQAVGQMQELAAATGSPEIQSAAGALQAFLTENTNSQTAVRTSLTLEAIDQLALYLQAIPGRKNVIWFTGSFPINTLSADPNMLRTYAPEVAQTANLLAAARIAIYPVGVGQMGLAPNRIYDLGGAQPPGSVAAGSAEQTITKYQNQSLSQESTERVQNNASLEELADNSGGKFFLNSNGFNDVLDRVVKTGTSYYTLTYSPTNRNIDGRLRLIQVKLPDGKYHLAYRRGYYATNDFMAPALKPAAKGDPLRPLMDHGTPDATGILYTMKVVSATAQPRTPAAGPVSRAGDNDKLGGPVNRYTVTFAIPPENLALETSGNGVHQGRVEATLLAYDRDGIPLNWMVRMVQVRVPRNLYALAQVNGVGFSLDMDVPASSLYLRSGLYDVQSNKAGTMEIPIAAVVPTPALAVSTASAPGSANHPPLSGRSASTNIPASGSADAPAPNVPRQSPVSLASAAAKELEAVDVPQYCSNLAHNQEHSASLAAVCEFVLNLRKKLTDIICHRETKREWTVALSLPGFISTANMQHSDVVTVDVSYRDGKESYSNVRVDGRSVADGAWERSGIWSYGEFVTMLTDVFAPSSKTRFHFLKETRLHPIPAFLFHFKVAAQDNHLYSLQFRDEIRFPQYAGKIWVDAADSSLLRLELQTGSMPDFQITQTKVEIEYSNLVLGDGASMVLPTSSKVLICERGIDCSHNLIKFTNWHKFRATTNIVVNPSN